MNGWPKVGLAAVGLSLLLWLALYAAYRSDRPDAAQVALVTVLLLTPPTLTYLAVMQFTQAQHALIVRVLQVYATALGWLIVQRLVLYPLAGFRVSLGESLANFILLPALGIAGWLGVRGFLYRRDLARAVALQRETELKLLEAQLAPHMLFNMLNTVYAALLTDRDQALDLFAAMTEALRHLMGDRTRRWIALRDEVAFIEHYSALERARNPATRITVETTGDMDAPIPPMLFATLFENAVKHGRLADGGLDIQVSTRVDDDRIELCVVNRIGTNPAPHSPGGLGLANVKSRLALLYSGQASLDTHARDGRFVARIRIEP